MFAVQFFPSIQWFMPFASKKKAMAALPVLGDTLRKQAYVEIRGPNGLQQLNIPLYRESLAADPQLASPLKWRAEFLNSIATAYGSAPFFEFYFAELEAMMANSGDRYVALCFNSIRLASNMLGWHPPEFYAEPGNALQMQAFTLKDYGQRFTDRYAFSPDVSVLDLVFNCGPISSDVLAGKQI